MLNEKRIARMLLSAVMAILWSGVSLAKDLVPPTTEEIQKMEQAASGKAYAVPEKPRLVLVFDRTEGFVHDSIPFVDKAIEILGQKSGAYKVEISSDMAAFKAENLSRFDAVLLNNTTKLVFDEAAKKSLLDFVRSGKGLIGIHAATDNFYDWPEAAEMINGTFVGHPWTSGGTWAFKVEDSANPVAAPLTDKKFKLSDEIYLMKLGSCSRRTVHMLVSLDLTDAENLKPDNVTAEIVDAPVSWIREYGKGRVFYCSLGHNKPLMWDAAVLGHYLAGIQYALGDLKADASPSYVDWDYLQYGLDNLHKYDYGQDQRYLNAVDHSVRDACGSKEAAGRVEKALVAFLQSDATPAAKQFVCRQLRIIGTEASVAVLGEMLTQAETSDMARYALEPNLSSAASDALLAALPKTAGKEKIGIINSLGMRGVTKAVKALSELTADADAGIATAAVEALGNIADDSARGILAGCVEKKEKAGAVSAEVVANSYLKCADALAKAGKKAEAIKIYQQMYAGDKPQAIRLAAIRGLIVCDSNPGAAVLKVLREGDQSCQAVALGLVGQMAEVKNLKELAGELSKLKPESQVQLLAALGQRNDLSVRDEVTQAAKNENVNVRMAAMEALANLGDDSAVILLAQAAANGQTADEKGLAQQCLYNIRGSRADDVIVKSILDAETKVKIELISSVAKRNIHSASEVLFKTAVDPEVKVRIESYRSLKKIAAADFIDTLINLVKTVEGTQVRKEAEYALRAACGSIREKAKQPEPIIKALEQSTDSAFRCSMVNVLGALENNDTLDLIRKLTKDEDQEVKKTAIHVLADWPNAKPIDDLKKISLASWNTESNRVYAAMGYVRDITKDDSINSDAKVELFREALKLYDNQQVRIRVFSELGKCGSFKALDMAVEYMRDPQLSKEAEAAVQSIGEMRLKPLSAEAKKILLKSVQE